MQKYYYVVIQLVGGGFISETWMGYSIASFIKERTHFGQHVTSFQEISKEEYELLSESSVNGTCGECRHWEVEYEGGEARGALGTCEYPNELIGKMFTEFKSKLPIALDISTWAVDNSDISYTSEDEGKNCNCFEGK